MKSIGFLLITLFALMLVFVTCGDDGSGKSNPDFSKLNPGCYVPGQLNPIIKQGDFFAGSNWNDPHVLKVGDQFIMYASADTNFSKNIKIYRLISTDGLNWTLSPSTAVFEKSTDLSAWDSESVETPAVIFFKNKYYLFYTGYDDQTNPSAYNVGYATSLDGISWTRQSYKLAPTNPGVDPDLNFMQYVVGEPAPVVFNDKIYLYFTAQGANIDVMTTLFTIGLVTSEDGENWSAPEQVLLPDQTIYPRDIWHGYSTPHAIVLNNEMHIYFDVAKDPFKQERFHHAKSNNGKTDWVLDTSHFFDLSDFSWADDQINGPAVLLDGNRLHLWFGGQGDIASFPDISMGIAYAKCQL